MGLRELGGQRLLAARPLAPAEQMQHGGEGAEQEEDQQRQPGDVLVAAAIAHQSGQNDPRFGRGREERDERGAERAGAEWAARLDAPSAAPSPRLALWPPHPMQAGPPEVAGAAAADDPEPSAKRVRIQTHCSLTQAWLGSR